MSLYILDTDILSLLQDGEPTVVQRVSSHPPSELAITVISVEEQLDGWYTRLRRARRREELAMVYERLARAVSALGRLPILTYTEKAIERFEQLHAMRLNVGSYDLRIAAIALEHNAIVVTRNLRDFGRIPSVTAEDWAA